MIKAVVFDCFGVLVTEGWLPFKSEHFGSSPELFQQATDLSAQANAGMISYDDFIKSVASLSGESATEIHSRLDKNVSNEELFSYIKELKKSYKIGMLSNAAANWLEELFTPDQLEVFDAIVLSYESGVIKPQPEAFKLVAERLDVEVNEAVLIDDQERHCTGARDAGMKAILYKDFQQVRAELEKLLADSKG